MFSLITEKAFSCKCERARGCGRAEKNVAENSSHGKKIVESDQRHRDVQTYPLCPEWFPGARSLDELTVLSAKKRTSIIKYTVGKKRNKGMLKFMSLI